MNLPTKNLKKVKFKFWIKSSRGTDESEVVSLTLPKGEKEFTEDEVKDELEHWCSKFGAWHVSENMVRYGYDLIN